ncbi:hypothetical protein H8E77_38825 [bacterium]|nr:hypothetical protein [bacterium]
MKSNERFSQISLIVDSAVGPATRRGLNKIRLALQEKGVSFEEVGELEAAHGDILIVAGLGNVSSAAWFRYAPLLNPGLNPRLFPMFMW